MHYAKLFDHVGMMTTIVNRLSFIAILCIMAAVTCIGLVNGVMGENPYITVNPVETKSIGDMIILSGETNLEEGTRLFITLEKAGCNSGTVVIRGNNTENRWVAPIDSWGIKPGEYLVNVTEVKGYNLIKTEHIYGDVNANTPLVLTGTFLGSDTSIPVKGQEHAFITLDPIPDKKTGDLFLITGKTNLSVGTDIIWEVRPTILDTGIEISGNPDLSGIMANSQVTRETGINRVSLALNTYEFNPDEYNVSVSTIEGEIFGTDMKTGPVSDFKIFTLKNESPSETKTKS